MSVIIPCYNQGRFLGDAIESALRQSLGRPEVIVVDDGSLDDSGQVAGGYAGVRVIRQENRGLSAARNAGIDASTGDYLVFLDADDRLLPRALESGARCLEDHPDCAFVYGGYRLIAEDGSAMASPPREGERGEPYLDMLRSNYIGMHATVMYRRTVFDSVGRFDTSRAACEDYDLYLRITRNFPVRRHDDVVAEYRQHGENMSLNPGLMLKTSLSVLGAQRKYARGNKKSAEAYKAGVRNWQKYYGKKLMKDLRSRAKAREWDQVLMGALTLLRYYPRGVVNKATEKITRMAARAPKIFSIRLSR
ncbi:MAG TPA: glycosyltransferase [Blastocatellia bacterium]|nr:glycosyltransferase [Blastocatellia bacterium]